MIRPISITEFKHIDKVVGRLSRIETPEYQAIYDLKEGEGIKIAHSRAFPCTRKGNCALTTLVYNIARVTGGRYETSHIGPRDVGNNGQTCDHMSRGSRSGQVVAGKHNHKVEGCGHGAVFRHNDRKDEERV